MASEFFCTIIWRDPRDPKGDFRCTQCFNAETAHEAEIAMVMSIMADHPNASITDVAASQIVTRK